MRKPQSAVKLEYLNLLFFLFQEFPVFWPVRETDFELETFRVRFVDEAVHEGKIICIPDILMSFFPLFWPFIIFCYAIKHCVLTTF